MRNNIFLKSTIILLLGGSITKILGFFIRIIITRIIGIEGLSLYSLIMPTYSLLITLATLSYPVAISKCISEADITKERRSKKIIFSVIPVSLLINLITILIIILIDPIISSTLLKEDRIYYPLIACALTLPFISLSSITKGYFWGKQRMFPYMLSNVCEQIVRLIILSIILPLTIKQGLVLTIFTIIIINIISETSSILVMSIFLPKSNIKLSDLKIDRNIIKDVYDISIPSTTSKLIGSIGYFFEPIILTNTLLFIGYDKSFILREYGIINGYALSLLMLPSFFVGSISTSLIPEITKWYKKGNKKLCIKRVKQIVLLSFIIGFSFTLIIFLFPNYFLKLIFNTNLGVDYIRVLSPFILLLFIDGPIISSLQALNKSKTNMYISLTGVLIKLITLFITSLFHIGLYSLIISIIVNLIYQTSLNYRTLKKALTN